MKTLLLPGVNPKTIQWLDKLTNELSIANLEGRLHKYKFWEEENSKKNLNTEVSNLPSDHYDLVIAKSFGTLVLLKATIDNQVTWDKAIVFGVPLKIVDDVKFNKNAFNILKKNNILIVQQRNDILGAAEDLQKYCGENLLIIKGNDHQYEQFKLYSTEVANWLN